MSARACPGPAAREGFALASRRLTRGPRRPPPRPPCRRCGQVPAPDPDGSARRGRIPQALATAGRPAPPGWPAGAQRRRGRLGRPRRPVRTRQHHPAAHGPTSAPRRPRLSSRRSRGRRPSATGTNARRHRPPTTRRGPCHSRAGGCRPTAAAWTWNRRPARAVRNHSQRRSAAAIENRNAPTATARGIQARACRP